MVLVPVNVSVKDTIKVVDMRADQVGGPDDPMY